MSCTHRRSVRFPQVFPSVTVDQGVRELLQQGPLDSLERSTTLGFGSTRGDRENRDLSSNHKGTYSCQHHRSLRGSGKSVSTAASECQRLLPCRHSGVYEHVQCFFDSEVAMDCGDNERCTENRSFSQLSGPQSRSGTPVIKEPVRFENDESTLNSCSTPDHTASTGITNKANGQENVGSRVDSCFDPQSATSPLSFQSSHCYYFYRTGSNGSLSSSPGNVLRQIEDDDSVAGDFNCHHFLDNDSRQRWNLQHGITDLVRYCWANGPGSSPSPGPVSSSCSDLAAHLATIDKLHDQYLESYRYSGSGKHNPQPLHIPTHGSNITDSEDHIWRMRLVYNWFITGSSPREKRGQERRTHSAPPTDRNYFRNSDAKTKTQHECRYP